MNRILPTEGPDEPVNRLAPYLPQDKSAVGVIPFDLSLCASLTQESSAEIERTLKKLSARYEKDVSSPIVVKELIRCLYLLRKFEDVLAFAEYFHTLSLHADSEIKAFAQAARRAMGSERSL